MELKINQKVEFKHFKLIEEDTEFKDKHWHVKIKCGLVSIIKWKPISLNNYQSNLEICFDGMRFAKIETYKNMFEVLKRLTKLNKAND